MARTTTEEGRTGTPAETPGGRVGDVSGDTSAAETDTSAGTASNTAPEGTADEAAEITDDAGTDRPDATGDTDDTAAEDGSGDDDGEDDAIDDGGSVEDDEFADGSIPGHGAGTYSRPIRVAAIAIVTAAALCAGYFGWSWYSAAHDDSLAFSRDRDVVLRAGEQGVQNMNTLDYRTVDQDLATWENSSTGALHDELVQGRPQFEAQVRQARTVTTAKVLDAAVTELDDRAGKAGMVIALQITVTPETGAPTTKQSRMRAQLERTAHGWKLSALGQAPVGSAG